MKTLLWSLQGNIGGRIYFLIFTRLPLENTVSLSVIMDEAGTSYRGTDVLVPLIDPVSCENCFISCLLFWKSLFTVSLQIIILTEKNYRNCDQLCRLDSNKKAFRCDKTFVSRGKRKRRCNFYFCCFKGFWLHKCIWTLKPIYPQTP